MSFLVYPMIVIYLTVDYIQCQNIITGSVDGSFDFEKCGESVSCLSMTPGCEPRSNNCGIVQWRTLNEDEHEIILYFWSEADSWVGVGFSRDTNMGEDDIYYCQKRSGTIGVLSAYSIGMSRPIEVENSGEIIDNSVRTWQQGNEYACTFRRPTIVMKNDIEYDLSTGGWYVLLSTGGVASEETQYHGASSSGAAISSNQRVLFSSTQPHIFLGAGNSSGPALKAHAILMVISWALLAPIGLFIARFIRRENGDHQIGQLESWFVLHRGMMVVVVGITLISLITILITRGGWSESAGTHAIIGIITIILAILNPISALLRPDKTSEKRFLFNVFHQSNGYLTLAMAISAIFLGMDLALLDLDLWVTQLFSFEIIFIGLTGITVELFKSKLDGKKNMFVFILFSVVIAILSFIIIGDISSFSFNS